jgi:hypothetical protein
MSVAVKAIFENGKVTLQEPAPTNEKVPVIVTFPDAEKSLKKNEIKFGSLAGKINVPADFDDELDDLNEYMQ